MSGSNALPAGQAVIIPPLGGGFLAPGNTSLNGGFGGQGAANARPLSLPPQYQVRQPYLGQPALVVNIANFGTGAGAGIVNNGSDADQSQGVVAIKVGLNPSATQVTVMLSFPAGYTAGQYFFTADWGAIANNFAAGIVVLTVTLNRPLVTGEVLLLPYNWTVSQ